MNQNWDSQGDWGGGFKPTKTSVGGVWKFFGTTQSQLCDYLHVIYVV